MTRVLVLGGTGMLGHKLGQVLGARMETWTSVRDDAAGELAASILDPTRMITGVRAEDLPSVERALAQSEATVAVNAIGIVKQAPQANDTEATIAVNALFPHELAARCRACGVRLIHISTDCVFSGRRGSYRESDLPDAEDLYGRSKLLSELAEEDTLTLRTSIIGRELRGRLGLLEWFLANQGGRVRGYSRARFSALSTGVLAELVGDIIERHTNLTGVWHVSSKPIDKLRLLELARAALEIPVEIEPDDTLVVDRSLDSTRLQDAIGWTAPSWTAMLGRLAADPTPYDALYGEHARR